MIRCTLPRRVSPSLARHTVTAYRSFHVPPPSQVPQQSEGPDGVGWTNESSSSSTSTASSTPKAAPFFRDPEHTVPTKWSLYRPLLRHCRQSSTAPFSQKTAYPSIAREIRDQWKRMKGMTSVPRVRAFLEEYYVLLDHLQLHARSDPNSDHASQRNEEVDELETRLKEKHERIDANRFQAAEAEKEKFRGIVSGPTHLTGGYHRPTLFNPPLPRLKPQPIGISMMIHNRLRKRERRMDKRKVYASLLTDMRLEVGFWKDLEKQERAVSSASPSQRNNAPPTTALRALTRTDPKGPGGWDAPIRAELALMDARFKRENQRSAMVYDGEIMDRVEQAKVRAVEYRRLKKAEEKARKREEADKARAIKADKEKEKEKAKARGSQEKSETEEKRVQQ